MTSKEKSVARLRKINLSESVAEHLAGKGISSVTQLAGISLKHLEDLLRNADLYTDSVPHIRKRAMVMKALVDNHLVTVRGQVSPVYKRLPSTNTNNNIINFHEGMESYPEMFGHLDYAPDAEFDSMISPAAYLVDLMRYINEFIVQPPNEEDKPLLLKNRRPDIWNIPLDMENTVHEIPYLQLVNEILKTRLDKEGKVKADGTIDESDKIGHALQYMAETIFPFNLPFNTPLEQIRKYLNALQTELYDIYKTFNIDPEAQTREYLRLSPEQTAYLTTPLVNKDSLNLAYGNIKTNDPKPHFTGITDNDNLGGLTNAEVFMNQVGFAQTSRLESLFYQNINRTLPGANELLNNLFINKSSGANHLIYSPAETTGPDWADGAIWADVSYYSTIKRVIAGEDLYVLVRTKDGIETWLYNNSHKNWVLLSSASPAWSDEEGWDQEMYYSTIQAVAVQSSWFEQYKLYLFGRYKDGIHTWVFDTLNKSWSKLAQVWPQWTNADWGQPQYYRTIKTAVVDSKIILLGRQPDGMEGWWLDTETDFWSPVAPGSPKPDFTDSNNWNDPECYLTIQVTAYDGQLFLIGRSHNGMETYSLIFIEGHPATWVSALLSDAFSDKNGGNNPWCYLTIQTFKANGLLHLLGSGPNGIELYTLALGKHVFFEWIFIPTYVPNWSPTDWHDPSRYLTIKGFAIGTYPGLLARSATGIQTWQLLGVYWQQLESNSPAWSDAAGWNDPSYYTSIHTVKVDQSDLLLGCTKKAIEAWRFDTSKQVWVKEKLVKAVIELENNGAFSHLNMVVLDRLNRFIRLAAILEWPYEDLDWAFIALGAQDINMDSIAEIKNLQWIMDTLRLTCWQATALWHDIKTYGEGNGPVSQAPFDLVFNQPMPFIKGSMMPLNDPVLKLYHPLYQPNPNYQDEPVVWQTDGRSAGSHAIVFRLMAALNLDAGNLKALADYLKDSGLYSNSNEIILTVENLSVLYRYALLANSLKLSIPEFVILLEFLGLKNLLQFSSNNVVQIITANQWMVENKLTVYQLNYICNTISSKWIDPGFDLLKVPDLLKSLSEAATPWYLNARQLQFGNLMTETVRQSFYNTLSYKKYIDDRGIMLKNDFSFPDVSNCFFCETLSFAAPGQLRSACKVGKSGDDTASKIYIPIHLKDSGLTANAWKGSVSMWFNYDGKQTGTCTLYSLAVIDPIGEINITKVQIAEGNIVLSAKNETQLIVYKLPPVPQWHFLVISYSDQLISLNGLLPLTKLTLPGPPDVTCVLSIGDDTDSFETAVTELRLFNSTVKAAAIVTELYPSAKNPNGPITGNTNYWPLNEGQGVETAKDVAGDINGRYAGKNGWSILYNTVIPDGFGYLNQYGNLTPAFDPVINDPACEPFVDLWKMIVNLRNILNTTISTQKEGTLQKLAAYYQLNKDLALYADYIAEQDEFPDYVQALLAYRFSLSWQEFSLDLNRSAPFISSNLINQFAANNITITSAATIERLTDEDGNPAEQWHISETPDDVFFLSKSDGALNIYKLLPATPAAIFHDDGSFPADPKYSDYYKFHIDKNYTEGKPAFYYSACGGAFAVLLKKGKYVQVATYPMPGTDKDVVAQINSFIADLGQLLFTVKTLKLSDDEFKCIVDNEDRFFDTANISTSGVFSLAQVKAVVLFKKLNNTYVVEDMSFSDYFYLADDTGSLVNYVAKLTQWDAQGLRQLSQWNCLYTQFAAINLPGSADPSQASVGAGSNYAIAGYPLSNAVFVYQLKGEQWEPLPPIIAPKGAKAFGAAVTIQNYTDAGTATLRAIVADTSANSGAGVVYIYEYNPATDAWDQSTKLTAPDAAAGDAFGSSVTIYRNTLAIGAPHAGIAKSGNVYIFENVSNKWVYQKIDFKAPSGDKLFGNTISLYNDIITIGSAGNASIFKIANSAAVPVIPPVACNTAKVVTNGDFVVMSAMSGTDPVISYITDVNSSDPSTVKTLTNPDFSGICTIAIEDDTLMVNDSSNTCFVYYIQDNILSYRNSFKAVSLPASAVQPWPIALSDGNLVIGGVHANKAALLFYGTKHNINWFGFADECFTLAGKLGVSIGSLLGFISLSRLEMEVRSTTGDPAASSDQNMQTYAAYESYANKLAGALAMGRSAGERDSVYTPLRNKFFENQRNALAGYMIFSLRYLFADITTINDLYELLLIDVGSGGCRSISRIKAALNSLQLYIERCRMQLEPHTSVRGGSGGEGEELNAADVEWSWMSHYRIWEANREVFLFPEKYFDPTLRKDKTSAYGDLRNKLNQSDLTNVNAIAAFQDYFHDLEALTALMVTSCCMGRVAAFVNGRIIIKNTWYIFAKTKNRNEGYFYRTADAVLPGDTPDTWINWTNWEKINTSIKADSAACVFANGRPYLFWIEFTKQQVSGNDSTYTSDKSFRYVTKAYYSFQNANGQWTNPHEVPDPANALNFTVAADKDKQPLQVTLPDKPDITVLNSFLDIADLSIKFTVANGTPTPPPPLTIPIDDILNLYDRVIWPFQAVDSNGLNQDLRSKFSLGKATGAALTAGTDLFANRQVLGLSDAYKGGLTLPAYFNSWFNDSFTLGIWINGTFPAGTGPAGYWPVLWPSASIPLNQFYFQIQGGYPAFGVGARIVTGKTQLKNNSWYFIVFRYNKKTAEQSVFVNGVLDNQLFTTPDLMGSSQYLFANNGTQYASGNIADMFTIHAPLADTEILSIYKEYINFEISDDVENYEWQLDAGFDEVQDDKNNALLPSSPDILFAEAAAGPFAKGRQVLVLNSPYANQFVSLPGHFNTFFNHSFTIGIWIYGGFSTTGDWPILSSSVLTPGEAFCLLIRNGKAFMDFYDSSTAGNATPSANTWHNLVFTYDEASQTQSIYIDGVPDASSTGHLPYMGSSTLKLGTYNNEYASGLMANLLVVNEALSASEILAIYNGTVKPNVPPAPSGNIKELNSIQDTNGRRIQLFSEDLFMGGADYLFSKNSVNIIAADLSSKAPYGKYMWELFYHIPMLIAQLLSSNKKFEDARHWYEYIFNPVAADKSNDRFWQLGYFRSLGKPEDIVQILTDHSQNDQNQILLYDLDPFDPEAIAYLRPGAFEKKTVISYIGNLLDWGDSLFSQYTWETTTQAEMLYVLAKELLGKRPDISGAFTKKTPMTIAGIEQEYQNDIPQFVIDIEDMQPALHERVQATPQLSASVSNFYFGIPDNDELTSFQDLVDTRLFEIRNCLNILGQQQSLALFEPPVNPMALVAAGAAGLNPADVPISYAADIPYFRFTKLIGYAKSVTERVVDFGRQILSALEKNDEELLAMLRIIQEKAILDLTTSIKEKQVQETMNQALVLDQSLANANERVAYYTGMLAQPVSVLEALSLALNLGATVIEAPAAALRVAAMVGHLVPTVYGFADGDFSPGGAIEAGANALSTESGILNNLANMTAVSASYVRRAEEWELQLKLAQYEVTSITIQKAINSIQVQNAQSELAVHNQSITNNDNLQRFYTSKFTNRELYQWMIDQISSVYYQAFQMARDLAKKAQVAYQFELNTNESIISYGYWNNMRRGLLAGEKLITDLERLEKAYIDNNQRYLEIQKIVSLKDISIIEFVKLIKTGTCRISITEQLYDWDFPGHYNRKIKSVTITIPAVVGPYQTIKATLVQQSNKVVTKPDLNTVKYLVSKEKVQPPVGNSLRINWRPNQQIAISKAGGDSGLFELNFNDDRYLPFEGTGAISEWQLSIPQATNAFDLNTISDVILYINYTAQDGGDAFAQQVLNLPEIKNYKGTLVVSIKQQFNQAWNTFMTTGSATFSANDLQFPPNLQPPVIDESDIVKMYRTTDGNDNGIDVKLSFNNSTNVWEISYNDQKRAMLLDMILEIPYTAELRQ